jgi:hypothetical protein
MTRAEAFVFVALTVDWPAIAACTFRIARKMSRLGRLTEQAGPRHSD